MWKIWSDVRFPLDLRKKLRYNETNLVCIQGPPHKAITAGSHFYIGGKTMAFGLDMGPESVVSSKVIGVGGGGNNMVRTG